MIGERLYKKFSRRQLVIAGIGLVGLFGCTSGSEEDDSHTSARESPTLSNAEATCESNGYWSNIPIGRNIGAYANALETTPESLIATGNYGMAICDFSLKPMKFFLKIRQKLA